MLFNIITFHFYTFGVYFWVCMIILIKNKIKMGFFVKEASRYGQITEWNNSSLMKDI